MSFSPPGPAMGAALSLSAGRMQDLAPSRLLLPRVARRALSPASRAIMPGRAFRLTDKPSCLKRARVAGWFQRNGLRIPACIGWHPLAALRFAWRRMPRRRNLALRAIASSWWDQTRASGSFSARISMEKHAGCMRRVNSRPISSCRPMARLLRFGRITKPL